MSKKLLILLLAVLISSSSYGFTDSLWIVGAGGCPGNLVPIGVWLQYEGGGESDSMSSFDIILTWDGAVCSVESYTLGQDFIDMMWSDLSRIDNYGVVGPPSGKPKIGLTALCPGLFKFIPRGSHLAATIDFRILTTAIPGDSAYIDTSMEAFSPPISLEFVDKGGVVGYKPTYAGGWIVPGVADDVGPISIISPPSEMFVDSTYTPSAVIKNFGSDSVGPVPIICTIDSWADTAEIVGIGGFESTTVNFANWTVPEPGVYTVTVVTQYAGDTNRANDTLSMAVCGYLLGDVGPGSITSPPDTVYVWNTYVPSATIKNFGTDSAGPIPVICNIDSWADTVEAAIISGNDSTIVNFDNWTVPDTGVYSVTILTQYFADTNAANDTIIKSVQAFISPGDVGPDSVISPPDSVYSTYNYTPSARVVNFGGDPVGPIPVICFIDGWADTVEILSMAGLDSTIVNFDNWTVPDTGIYSVTVFAEYLADTNLINDTILKSVYATFPPSDRLWVIGGQGSPGDLVPMEVWLQYEGGGVSDSMSSFDIILTWDGAVCSVESYTLGQDFMDMMWWDYSRIDNHGVAGPPSGKPKIGLSAYWPLVPLYLIPRGVHLAATIDFRILSTAIPGDSAYIDTLMEAFSPPRHIGYVDKWAMYIYSPSPSYTGGWIFANPVGMEKIVLEPPLPSVHGLSQSYPNPMSTSMSVCYQIAKRSLVSLKIFDNAGRLVRILVEAEMEPGYYTAKWDGRDSSDQSVPSGIYFYRLEVYTGPGTRGFLSTKKIVLLQ